MRTRVVVLCTLLAAVAVVFGTGAAASGDDNSSRAAPEAVGAATSIPTSGLIGHWPLDGNALDTSGHGNDGTIVGATPTTGIEGGAYEFDGTAHIDLPNFVFPTSTYTVSIWFETTRPIIVDDTGRSSWTITA